tara:strand:+ start:230 stop:646 length:417 start_codon:yes stop_codon:yes gene_type:complete
MNASPAKIKALILHPTSYQIFKFCCIGLLAAIVNFAVDIFLVHHFNWHPWVANILGFLISFQVSFLGQRYWTFKTQQTKSNHRALGKFFIVATFSFILNMGLYGIYLLVIPNYLVALFCTFATVPPITFVLSKVWAFK